MIILSAASVGFLAVNARPPATGVGRFRKSAPNPVAPLSRYTDSTLSVALGTVQVSVAVMLIPVDPGSNEVVQFTYKVFDTSQALVETETISYVLTENNLLSFYSAATQSASGTLTVTPQLAQ